MSSRLLELEGAFRILLKPRGHGSCSVSRMRLRLIQSASFALLAGCSSPRVLSSPTLPSAPQPSEAADANEVQREVAETLARVVRVMAPICENKCGIVGAAPDLELDSGAGTVPSVSGYASLILYRPDGSCIRETEEARFYCMAHEYGHHLDVAMTERRSRYDWAGELRADALAGCALSRAGVSLERLKDRFDSWTAQSRHRFSLACGVDDNHPALEWTWQAIRVGAETCGRPTASKTAVVEAVGPVIDSAHEQARRERKRLERALGTEPCLAPLR